MQTAPALTGAASRRIAHQAHIRFTRTLLAGGALAGPLYLTVGLAQAFTRPGFDITRHALSLLSNGNLGWIHITNLIVSGLLVVAGAAGVRRALTAGRGRTWAPILIGLYGASLVAAGLFKADPAQGFPLGTPADAMVMTPAGMLHLMSGAVGFLGLIAATLVMARRFAGQGQRGWMLFSVATGIIFFASFVGISTVWNSGWTILGFWIGVVLAWAWLSAISAKLRAELAASHSTRVSRN